MSECLFCKIATKEIQAKDGFLFENENVVAFNDINPKSPVHILIVLKSHIESIKTIKDEDAQLIGEMFLVAKKLAQEKNLEGYKLVFNVGREGGQVIDHLHLHLLSGWESEYGAPSLRKI